MDFDQEKVDEVVLALLFLTVHGSHGETRAWKSHDWETMHRLFAKGYIFDPQNKSKSVLMTEEGVGRSKELFQKYFGRSA